MKTSIIRVISLILAFTPVMATAQDNILSAFDAIIKCPDAKVTESHYFDKDLETNIKTGQCDQYRFYLPASKANLITDVFNAFDNDSDMAYSLNRGYTPSIITLAIGDGSVTGVPLNQDGQEFVYALFLAPQSEDPEGIHRYAYGMSYKKEDNKITGLLVITYATTLQYRQKEAQKKQFNWLHENSDDLGNVFSSSLDATFTLSQEQTWFEQLMNYLTRMQTAKSSVKLSLATKAYSHIRNISKYDNVSEGDKNAAREILKSMISDKNFNEPTLNTLLIQCLNGL